MGDTPDLKLGLLPEVPMTSERFIQNHNLPAPVSSFIGREQEIIEIRQCLHDHRLITLTGVGGVGKTRLALEAATTELDSFSDGVWLIDLAPLTASEVILETISKVFRLPELVDLSTFEQLAASLESRHVLLVLDNCEHVIEECARIATSLLARCSRVTLLATSREPLSIRGEVVFRVPALNLPDATRSLDWTRFLSYDSIHFFVERAHAADRSFHLTKSNAPVVAAICQHLDGLPLALELAAVRVSAMSVAEILKRLDQRFHLLTSGDRTVLARQQTLRATIEWSYRLLSKPEQVVLRRLGIFVGGFELQAAENMCAGASPGTNETGLLPPETIQDHLLQLVNKSLLQFNQENSRYRLLESIRLFALEQLVEVGEIQQFRSQHLAWYLQRVEHPAPNLPHSRPEEWLALLEAEYDNLRAALGWAIESGRAEEAARCALALWPFWRARLFQREGIRWLERILLMEGNAPSSMVFRPHLLNALGVLSHTMYKFDQAAMYHAEALRLFQERDDCAGLAQVFFDLGWKQFEEMKLTQARASATKSLVLARQGEDPPAIARALLLGALAATEGDLGDEAMDITPIDLREQIIPAVEESLAIWRALGDRANIALAFSVLARAEEKLGNYERVAPFLHDAIRLHVQMGNYIQLVGPMGALCRMGIRSSLQPEGTRLAAQVLGIMANWEETIGGETSPWSQGPAQRLLQQSKDLLGFEAFTQAFDEGRQMTFADLIRLSEQITASLSTSLVPDSSPFSVTSLLTPREGEVLRLLAQGLTSAQMAKLLVVSVVTVNFHIRSIYSKLGISSRSAATRYAIEHHLM